MHISDIIQSNQHEMEHALLAMLSIESTNQPASPQAPFGPGVAQALAKITEIAQNLGLHAENHDYYVTIDLGTVEKPHTAIGVLAHTDIVPIGDGWDFSPLGQLVDDKIYGRGSLDDKGPAIATLYAMAALKQSGIPLAKPIRLIIGGNEEKDSRCMQQYLAENIPLWGGFSPDAQFPVIFAEKGIAHWQSQQTFAPNNRQTHLILEEIQAGTVVNAVPGKAIAILHPNETLEQLKQIIAEHPKAKQIGLTYLDEETIQLTAIGKAAHGSLPEQGENAIATLLEVLLPLPWAQMDLKQWLQAVYQLYAKEYQGQTAGIACSDEISGPLTLNLGVLRYQKQRVHIELDIRYPVTINLQELIMKLCRSAQQYGIALELIAQKAPLYVPQESNLVQKLLTIYQEKANPLAEPLAIGGGTYCRSMPNFVAFGPLREQDEDTMHQANEYITREHLLFLCQIYAEALYQLAK